MGPASRHAIAALLFVLGAAGGCKASSASSSPGSASFDGGTGAPVASRACDPLAGRPAADRARPRPRRLLVQRRAGAAVRVSYGPRADAMVERQLVDVERGTNTDVVFRLDGGPARAHFTVTIAAPSDGGGATFVHGPATLDAGDGVVHALTERTPAPTSLPGFSFTCF